MAIKPADVGDSCYLYNTYGKCFYGLACHFAKAHTAPDFKNTVNEERVKACEGTTPVKNTLDRDLKNQLRRRSVTFKKSEKYLKTIAND